MPTPVERRMRVQNAGANFNFSSGPWLPLSGLDPASALICSSRSGVFCGIAAWKLVVENDI